MYDLPAIGGFSAEYLRPRPRLAQRRWRAVPPVARPYPESPGCLPDTSGRRPRLAALFGCTEMTDDEGATPTGWIFFDAQCRLCRASRRRWGRIFERRGFVWLPIQTPGVADRLGVSQERLMAEMWFLPAGGLPASGVNAWTGLMRCVWWLKPFALVIQMPGINRLARAAYRWIARHRHCLSGQCRDATSNPRPVSPRRCP